MTELDRTLLVEAGAGTGKTAIIAGRILMLLAAGAHPKSIAAITFTELAASELAARVASLLDHVLEGDIPPELSAALPDGLDDTSRENLAAGRDLLDQLTVSTIHGFCQRLLVPYPVEAGMDPGARVIDPDEAGLVFDELMQDWLRERLSADATVDDFLGTIVKSGPGPANELYTRIAATLQENRFVVAPAEPDLAAAVKAFQESVSSFRAFLGGVGFSEKGTEEIVINLEGISKLAAAAMDSPGQAEQIVGILTLPRPTAYTKTAPRFAAYRKKKNWQDAAAKAKNDPKCGIEPNEVATAKYTECGDAHVAMMSAAAGNALHRVLGDLSEVMERYAAYKREAALFDFGDLLLKARELLRTHEDVRAALGNRFKHLLIDEFQDTDPVQAEIAWRLAGDPTDAANAGDWRTWNLRDGALFLVGDPKQAIYRFRGADVATYVAGRTAIQESSPDAVLEITTNFRSLPGILSSVNEWFAELLSAEGQPGFAALEAWHAERPDAESVQALDIPVPERDGKAPNAAGYRDAEAEAVAEACNGLIGSFDVRGPGGVSRPCTPGDIALLAPGGTELWRYEQALEDQGIPVSTQAGKGFFRRQEVQDLIAITRVLADPSDLLALGAYLRGPMVGQTEEELLDIVDALSPAEGSLARIRLWTPLDDLPEGQVRWALRQLQGLARTAGGRTPYDLLSNAVEDLHVRALLRARHLCGAERALANVDLYLELSKAYAVRGLKAFADDMRANWDDAKRSVEGRPDAEEQAVSLITMHAAKGLEWPIVIPINTNTAMRGPDSTVVERSEDVLFTPVLGFRPDGYEAAHETEAGESSREDVRLWYVAATRARDLLLMPRFEPAHGKKSWLSLVGAAIPGLPAFSTEGMDDNPAVGAADPENAQDGDQFAAETHTIAANRTVMRWEAPSMHEGPAPEPELEVSADEDDAVAAGPNSQAIVQGGRERGLILHKLIEEVLTGETGEDAAQLSSRSEDLVRELGMDPTDDHSVGLSPAELADTVTRTLALPQVQTIRERLVAECPVHSSHHEADAEIVTSGVADAVAISEGGKIELVIDWKSDVDPDPTTLGEYREQVAAYLAATGAARGLVVLMTSGRVIEVQPTQPA